MFASDSGPAIACDRLILGGSLILASSSLSAAGDEPAMKLSAASIGGPFDVRGSYIVNERGSAVGAQGAVIGIRTSVSDFCHMESGGAESALDIERAVMHGPVLIEETVAKSAHGPGFSGVRAKVSDMLLGPGFYAEGNTRYSAVILAGVSVSGQFAVRRSRFVNRNSLGTNLHVGDTTVGGSFELPMAAIATGPRVSNLVVLDGLRYPRIPQAATLHEWIQLLSTGTTDYEAQPYRQLANGYKDLGDEGAARSIKIAQNRDRAKRGSFEGAVQRSLHLLSGFFIGYGYKPWRALIGLIGSLASATILVIVAGRLGLLVLASDPLTQCNLSEQLSIAAPSAGPIFRPSGSASCIYINATWAQAFALANFALQLFGWAFLTLFIAGFTGLIKKE